MRLVDTRFAGMAMGVGTAKILGRVHSAQIRLGNLHLPCSFSVLEGRSVDLLFGLDMLVSQLPGTEMCQLMSQKRHQCCIDLSTNTLRINNTEVPFLSEHELPEKARQMEEPEAAEGGPSAGGKQTLPGPSATKTEFPGSGQPLGAKPSSIPPRPAAPTPAGQYPEAHIESVSTWILVWA